VPASSPDNALVVDADGEAPEAEAAAAAQRCATVRLRRGEAVSLQARPHEARSTVTIDACTRTAGQAVQAQLGGGILRTK
jgi:hypothetical protein